MTPWEGYTSRKTKCTLSTVIRVVISIFLSIVSFSLFYYSNRSLTTMYSYYTMTTTLLLFLKYYFNYYD